MTEPLTFDIDEAAARLGKPFSRDMLEGRINELPHIKVGDGRGRAGRIGFSEEHLHRIVEMFSVEPAVVEPAVSGVVTRRRSA